MVHLYHLNEYKKFQTYSLWIIGNNIRQSYVQGDQLLENYQISDQSIVFFFDFVDFLIGDSFGEFLRISVKLLNYTY